MNFRIKDARKFAGISQKELAKMLGIAPATLSGYESGTHDPKSDILTMIADICGVSVDFLLGRKHEEGNPPALDDIRGSSDTELSKKQPELNHLLNMFHKLNSEGQKRLIDTADDMVRSGKYEVSEG